MDALLTGEVTGVSIAPSSFATSQIASRYTLTMSARIELKDLRDEQSALGEPERLLPPGIRSDQRHERHRSHGLLSKRSQRARSHERRIRAHHRQRHPGGVLTATPAAVRKQIEEGTPHAVYLLQGEDDVEKAALAMQFDDLVEEGLRAFNVEHIHAGDLTTGDKLLDAVVSSRRRRAHPADDVAAPRRHRVSGRKHADAEARKRRGGTRAGPVARPDRRARSPDDARPGVSPARQADEGVQGARPRGATIVECGAPEDVAAAVRWVKTKLEASGVDIDPAGARAMAVLAGFPERPRNDGKTGNVKRLRGEIDRLLLYTLGQKRITLDDVKEVAGPAGAAGRLGDDQRHRERPGRRGAAAAWPDFRRRRGPGKSAGTAGVAGAIEIPAIAPGEVAGAVEAVFRTDQDLKRSAGDPRVLLERLIVELCAGKRARARVSRRW